MATFLQGATDQFGPLELYRPDYSFLTQVYGTRQAQYDRGFQMVKSLHDSLLSAPVSNSENEKFRQDAFKKIQNQISEVSGMDLANSSFVNKASSVFDPITNDKELAYDMSVTNYYNKQRQIMNGYKNSNDPEKRKLYNQAAEQYLNMGQEKLGKSRRGTGEIFSAQPREFVIFEDVIGFLDEKAKEQGLERITEYTENGYVMKVTNGEGAVQPFEEWARMQMGDRFDKQFNVSGTVQTESAIKNIMETRGVNQSAARNILASELHPQMMEKIAQQGTVIQSQIANLEGKLQFINGKHSDLSKVPEVKEAYDNLVAQKKSYEGQVEYLQKQTADLAEKGPEYVGQNLEYLMTNESKERLTGSWARSNAMSNQKIEARPDQVALTQWQIQSSQQIANAQINATNARHYSRLEFDALKTDIATQQWEKDYDLKVAGMNQDMEIEEMRSNRSSNGSTKDKRTVTALGPYTSPNTAQSGITNVDILQMSVSRDNEALYNSVFGAGKGLLNMVVPESNFGDSYAAISSLKQYSEGQIPRLDQSTLESLSNLGQILGETIPENLTPQKAEQVIQKLSQKVMEKAKDNASFHLKIGNREALLGSVEAYESAISSVNKLMSNQDKHKKIMSDIAGRVLDQNGNVREVFEGARVNGYYADGTPMLDLSGMSPQQRESLNDVVGDDYGYRTRPVGQTFQINKMSDAEVFSLTNGNTAEITQASGGLEKFDLSSINSTDFRKVFGDNMDVSFDPIKKEAVVNLSTVSGTSTTAYGLKGGEKITFKIPYQTLNSSPALMEWAQMSKGSTIDPTDFGQFAPFASNPYSNIKASSYRSLAGFDYSVSGSKDENGNYGVFINIKGKDPVTNKPTTVYSGFTPISNPQDPQVWSKIGDGIEKTFQKYKMTAIQADALKLAETEQQ